MAKYRVGVIGCRGVGVRHASGLVGLPNAELARCVRYIRYPHLQTSRTSGKTIGQISRSIQTTKRCWRRKT